ncbi:MAG: ankyrin repeat domain-containing protein [Rhodospirillales bacterium]|nr:ankyrin repeat domain-containing protein [Rhodospirillales bacterium]
MKRFLRYGLLILAGCFAAASGDMVRPTAADAAPIAAKTINATKNLFQAVYADDMAGVRSSIDDGADIDAHDRWGMTPADIAIDRGHFRIAHFLVSVRNVRRNQSGQAEAAALHAPPVAMTAPGGALPVNQSPAKAAAPAIDSLSVSSGQAEPAAWPAGTPNPFDPATPAPGSQLRIAAPNSMTR